MTPSLSPPHVVVTGLMGIGKSTVADALAQALDRVHRDSDHDLQRLFARTGAELASAHGVAELHRLEAAVLLGALAGDPPVVISAAASVVEDARCRDALARTAVVVVLDAPVVVVAERMATGRHRRPMDLDELTALARRRGPLFDLVADVRVDATAGQDQVAAQAVAAVAPLLDRPPDGQVR
ncbi:MAG: shikimate kinase [Actinomycetota bacterium]